MTPWYSSSSSVRRDTDGHPAAERSRGATATVDPRPATAARRRRWLRRRSQRNLVALIGAAAVLAAVLLIDLRSPGAQRLTQRDIDQAVLHTLANLPPAPSVESVAFDIVRPSVVLVRSLEDPGDDAGNTTPGQDTPFGLGTGVVIVDDGTILTNLHVIAGSNRIGVVFADGTESPADLISVRPEQDLAVIKARQIPDDLVPATLTSSANLRMGDRVIAVGFPFGIGPSVSAGVVSGLHREYRTPDGERVLSDLIQFDAAVNPGNSGGPLVTAEGHVVGIVTAILNPTAQRFFVGIGFAVPIESAASSVGSSPF